MDKNALKDLILSKGYWEIVIRPAQANETLFPEKKELKEIIQSNSLHLRGWSYPFCPRYSNEIEATTTGVFSGVDFGRFKEIWHYDQSGQFVHYKSLKEDWLSTEQGLEAYQERYKNKRVLDTVNTVYFFAEVFEFARRLSTLEGYKTGIYISITLHGAKDRLLIVMDERRGGLWGEYICREEEYPIPGKTYSSDEIGLNSRTLSMDQLRKLFEIFNWDNQPIDVFKKDQDDLLEGRI